MAARPSTGRHADVIKANLNSRSSPARPATSTCRGNAGGHAQVPAEDDLAYAHNDDDGPKVEAIEARQFPARTSRSSLSTPSTTAWSPWPKARSTSSWRPRPGAQLIDVIKKLNAGEKAEALIVTNEGTFTQEQAKEALPNRKY